MGKKTFILVWLVALAIAPFRPAEAQQTKKVPRIAYLGGGSAELEKAWLDAFLQGLRELGYFEGKNIVVERRFAAGRYDELPGAGGRAGSSEGRCHPCGKHTGSS